MFSCIHRQLIGHLDLFSDVFAADIILTEAEITAFLRRGWALAPANRADTFSIVVTRWVAERSVKLEALRADERRAGCTTV